MGVVDTLPSVDSVDVETRVHEVSIRLREFEGEEDCLDAEMTPCVEESRLLMELEFA
jgi:hypothetical protein